MKRPKVFLIWIGYVFFFISGFTFANGEPSVKVNNLLKLEFPVPSSAEARAYLGLKNEDFFTIPQINAQVVIIEVFSMYCQFCQ